jgi:hypothetical protein
MVERHTQYVDFPSVASGKKSPVQDEVIERLRAQHPMYQKYSPLWGFYLSAYEGGEEFANAKNLFKHSRENQEDYDSRVDRLHNLNYCEPLVDFFTNFIFSETIDRDPGADKAFYEEFATNVNRSGDNVDAFMRQVCDDMQIFGMSYILVDAPVKPGEVISKQQEQEMGLKPYWVLVKPFEITNWVMDDFGNLKYVRRKQFVDDVVAGEVLRLELYTEFYPEYVQITKIDITDDAKPALVSQEQLPNDLGKIPFIVARYKRSKKYPFIGTSFLKDFAGNNREIMNLTSLLQEFLYRQAFNILTRQRDQFTAEVDGDEGEMGTSNLMEYPKDTERPAYITPPADPAQFIQDERGRIKNEMFMRAAQDFVGEIFNGEKSSGFSQAQSFSKTVPFISSRADALESVENQLMKLTMERLGETWSGKIKYKDRYELTNLTDALTQFQVLVKDLQIPSETFVKEQLKRFVREFDGKLPDEVRGKVFNEIDTMKFTGWKRVQEEALVGKQGTSPGEQQQPKGTGTMQEAAAEAKVKTAATTKLKKAA